MTNNNDGFGAFVAPAKTDDGWGKPVTPLPSSSPTGDGWGPSYAKPAADGWGAALTPAPAPGRDWTAPSARGQSAPPAAELPHTWAKPPEVQPRGSNWPCDTGQGTRYFAGYQNAANYVLLAGPYDTIEEAQARYEVAFERMKNDTALQFAFGAMDFKNMTVLTMPFEKAMRKGAYGRL